MVQSALAPNTAAAALGHLTDAPGGVLPQTVLQSADGPLQHYLVRDDVILVAPLDPADGQDQGASGADLPGGDGLEGQNRCGRPH